MPANETVVSVEIKARTRQIEVTTLRLGKGRHQHYRLGQVPPELRGEALQLIREGVLEAGYESLAELEEALTSEIVVPEEEDGD